MREIRLSGFDVAGGRRRSDGRPYTGTKLETADTAKGSLHATAPAPDPTIVCALAKACTPCGGKTPPGKLSLQPEALGAAHEVTT